MSLRDKLQRLGTPITEAKLGDVSPNKDATLPIPFGECHNVTPLLSNPATLEYGFLGAVESTFEVQTNGKPVTSQADLESAVVARTGPQSERR